MLPDRTSRNTFVPTTVDAPPLSPDFTSLSQTLGETERFTPFKLQVFPYAPKFAITDKMLDYISYSSSSISSIFLEEACFHQATALVSRD